MPIVSAIQSGERQMHSETTHAALRRMGMNNEFNYRDVEKLLAERGCAPITSLCDDLVQRYAPELQRCEWEARARTKPEK